MKGSYQRFYDGVGALVMGSATYQFILDHDGRERQNGPTRASRRGS